MRTAVSLALVCCLLAAACAGPSAEAEGYPAQVAPPGPPPDWSPPPPPDSGAVPDGQWVDTQQAGWVWMPFGDPYTYVPPDGTGEPLEYVFDADLGWTWLAAPWVWGIGPSPWFGRRGPRPFAWYRHGYWKSPQRWRYQPQPARDEAARRGFRPAPERGARAARPPEHRGGDERPRGEEPRGRDRGGGERGEGGGRGGAFVPGGGREGR